MMDDFWSMVIHYQCTREEGVWGDVGNAEATCLKERGDGRYQVW